MLDSCFIRDKWNEGADEFNRWDFLEENKKIDIAIQITKNVCADICNNLAIESEPDDFALDALVEAQNKIIEA